MTGEAGWARGPAAALTSRARGATAVAVALRSGERRACVTRGRTAHEGGHEVTDATRFEVGSLTKCFTALLLAERVARGEVAYGDPLTRFLPPEALPAPRSAPATLLHLATHTSGLPRLPPGLLRGAAGRWTSNPYAAFGTDDLLDALPRTRLHAPPGVRVHYSNLGVGLLGHLLTRPTTPQEPGRVRDHGPEYGRVLAARVLAPLGLDDTDCTAGRAASTAAGHRHGRARPPWEIPGLPGAGVVRSSARDLLALLDALLEPATAPLPLRTALTEAVRPRLALRRDTRRLALVWNIRVRPGGDVYHHSGGTSGFTAFAGFVPRHRTALVALANTGPGSARGFLQGAYETLLTLGRAGGPAA